MARRSVRCSCGQEIPLPEVPPSLMHCPRCGDAIRFSSPEGGPTKVRRDENSEPILPLAPSKPYYPLILLGVAGLAIAGGLVAFIIVFSGKPPRRPPLEDAGVRAKPRSQEETPVYGIPEIRVPAGTPKPPPPDPARPRVEATSASSSAEPLARAQRLVVRLNLAGLVATLYRLTGRLDDERALVDRMGAEELELRDLTAQLGGRVDVQSLKESFRIGDVLTGFAGNILDPADARPFAEALREWLATVQAGGTTVAVVQREGRVVLIPMWFPDVPPDLLPKAMRASGAPTDPILPFPDDVLNETRRRSAALPAYYRQALSAEDSARLARLLKDGRGLPEDLAFLRGRILGLCARAEAELASFEARVAVLEAALAKPVPDVVVLKDGRRLQGLIEEETDAVVRLRGAIGATSLARAEIASVVRGDALGPEFRRRYAAARGKAPELAALIAWCRERNLNPARELAAYALLLVDPGSDAAWAALGVADRAAPGPEFDVVWMTDGSRREGIITDESELSVFLDVVVRGPKAETIGTGKASIPRTQIARIERMGDAARKRAVERTASFAARARRTQEAVARIAVSPDTIQGMPGLKTSGTNFQLRSTCPAQTVRETAHTLEELFDAYRKHFAVRRNATKRIDVFFFATSAEYEAFQLAQRGAVAPNPAYFDPQANQIVAYFGVQKDEEARVRSVILNSEREIQQYKKDLQAAEDRLTKEFRALRQQVLDQAARARKGVEDPKAQAQIDRAKTEGLAAIKAQERTALDQLAKQRMEANQAIAEHEQVIRHNHAVLANQTRAMQEILFHEGFHAFAANFLWEEADNSGLPRWLHEGMATYFERSVVEAGELVHGGIHPTFLGLLRSLDREKNLSSVRSVISSGADLFQVRHGGDVPRQELLYAHAWGLAHYLLSRGMTREQIEAYVADVSAGKNSVDAFEKLAGRRIDDIDVDWRVHLSSLK